MNISRLILASTLVFSVAGCIKATEIKRDVLIYEIEVNTVLEEIRKLPNLVAYGKYTVRFFINTKEGDFKLYKLSDSIFVKMDNGSAFLISLSKFVFEESNPLKLKLYADTVEISRGEGYYLKIVSDRIEEFRGEGISAKVSDYAHEPVKFPQKWVIRYMGALVILKIDSIKILY
ncbi:MAG: hypothetical protein ABIL88_08320 [candidate division WOR-3 bacterium]